MTYIQNVYGMQDFYINLTELKYGDLPNICNAVPHHKLSHIDAHVRSIYRSTAILKGT